MNISWNQSEICSTTYAETEKCSNEFFDKVHGFLFLLSLSQTKISLSSLVNLYHHNHAHCLCYEAM